MWKFIRVEIVHPNTADNSPGEHGETYDTTCEGLTHAVDATSAPEKSVDAFILQDDPL